MVVVSSSLKNFFNFLQSSPIASAHFTALHILLFQLHENLEKKMLKGKILWMECDLITITLFSMITYIQGYGIDLAKNVIVVKGS